MGVLVHCKHGRNRSAALLVAYLLTKLFKTENVKTILKKVRDNGEQWSLRNRKYRSKSEGKDVYMVLSNHNFLTQLPQFEWKLRLRNFLETSIPELDEHRNLHKAEEVANQIAEVVNQHFPNECDSSSSSSDSDCSSNASVAAEDSESAETEYDAESNLWQYLTAATIA